MVKTWAEAKAIKEHLSLLRKTVAQALSCILAPSIAATAGSSRCSLRDRCETKHCCCCSTMSSAAFPRGGLKSEEAKDPKQEKKEKRKRKENDADLLATRKPAKRVDKAPAAEPEQHQQSTPLDVLTTTTIVKAARGKPAKLRPVRFASYHAETTVLGVVRSTSNKHALVSRQKPRGPRGCLQPRLTRNTLPGAVL